MSFFEELKRRNVIRVGIAYAIAAWLLLQISDLVLGNIAAPAWVIQVIMLLLAIGFPLVVMFAWAFEMTPEGLKKEKDVDRSQSIVSETGRKLDRMIIGVLTVTVAYLLIDKLVLTDPMKGSEPFSQQTEVHVSGDGDEKRALTPAASTPAAQADGPSIAVLPFVNMSGDTDNEYFSDGLTETLLHMLAQLPNLRVAARTSSFAFKGQNKGIQEIATALGVAHVLEGSVQKSGNRVRITAQLIRADDGFHVWSQSYDRTLEDIFAIQDEIATDVAGVLDAKLLDGGAKIAHVETSNLGAYDTYLRALEQQAIGSFGSLSAAESLFKQALGADPGFIDAKLGLARNYLMQFNTGQIDEVQMQQSVTPLLIQVREVQPDNRLTRAIEIASQTHAYSNADQDTIRRKAEELRLLLPMLPTESFIRGHTAGTYAFGLDQPDVALEILAAGLMTDPLSAHLYAIQGNVYLEMDRFEDARAAFLRAIELDPLDPNHYGRMSNLSADVGDITGVFEWRLKNIEADPQDHEVAAQMARGFYQWGLPEEGDRWLDKVKALAPNSDILQRLLIDRAHSRGDAAGVIAVAQRMIAKPADMRHDAFPTAVFSYRWYMSIAGRHREAYDFLVGVRPEITSFEQLPEDIQGILMQWISIELMSGFSTAEERKAAWEPFARNLRANGSWWFHSPMDQAWDFYFMGDLDSAIAKVREDLAKPLSSWPIRGDELEDPIWAPLASDPEIAARLSQMKREKLQGRELIAAMLEEPRWAK